MSETMEDNALWEDPLKQNAAQGILLSNHIDFYAHRIDMISPYDPGLLRPAAYMLTVGDVCIENGEHKDVEKNGKVTIPKNGLVYIKAAERLRLPYYLVGHYSLEVKLIYAGLVLDNGLQVDPGYEGHIYVPVYNLCSTEREIGHKDILLSIEFVRTTPFCPDFGTQRPRTRKQLVTFASGWTTEDLKDLSTDDVEEIRATMSALNGYTRSRSSDPYGNLVNEIEHLKVLKSLYDDNKDRFERLLREPGERTLLCRNHPNGKNLRSTLSPRKYNVTELNCLLLQALCPKLRVKKHRYEDSDGRPIVLFQQTPDDLTDRDFNKYLRAEDESHTSSLADIWENLSHEKEANKRFRGIAWITIGSVLFAIIALFIQWHSWTAVYRDLNSDSRAALRESFETGTEHEQKFAGMAEDMRAMTAETAKRLQQLETSNKTLHAEIARLEKEMDLIRTKPPIPNEAKK